MQSGRVQIFCHAYVTFPSEREEMYAAVSAANHARREESNATTSSALDVHSELARTRRQNDLAVGSKDKCLQALRP